MQELEKAISELAILVNQSTTQLKTRGDEHAAQITYLQLKLGEHETQLNELFGGSPTKLSQRLIALKNILDGEGPRLEDMDKRLHFLDTNLQLLTEAYNETVMSLNAHKADASVHPLA
jgi:archaellum component FlaC